MLRLEDITFSYAKESGDLGTSLFSKLSLSVEGGESLAIVGISGSGKTTLARLIAGYLRPLSGCIQLDDTLISGPNESIHLMQQSDSLLPHLSVLQNVLLRTLVGLSKSAPGWKRLIWLAYAGLAPRSAAGHFISCDNPTITHALESLSLFGLREYANAFPYVLSNGMRKRVELARAFNAGARLLVLDEPFVGLDAVTKAETISLFKASRHQYGFSTLLITHDWQEVVELADRVVVIAGRPAHIIHQDHLNPNAAPQEKFTQAQHLRTLLLKNSPFLVNEDAS